MNLVLRSSSMASSVTLSRAPVTSPPGWPALFTRMSIRPNAATVASMRASTRSARRTSVTRGTIRRPVSWASSLAASSRTSWVRAQMATSAPSRASSSATALPIPLLPPVINATFPPSSRSMLSSLRPSPSTWRAAPRVVGGGSRGQGHGTEGGAFDYHALAQTSRSSRPGSGSAALRQAQGEREIPVGAVPTSADSGRASSLDRDILKRDGQQSNGPGAMADVGRAAPDAMLQSICSCDAGVAQFGRVPAFQAGRRGFESHPPLQRLHSLVGATLNGPVTISWSSVPGPAVAQAPGSAKHR